MGVGYTGISCFRLLQGSGYGPEIDVEGFEAGSRCWFRRRGGGEMAVVGDYIPVKCLVVR